MSKQIYFIFKAGILTGALFFLSAQLSAQDTLRTIITPHNTADSSLIVRKKQSVIADTPKDSILRSDINKISKPPKVKWIPQPERATILSAVLPGLGQVYNRKYWKVPILYAAGGVLYYFYYINDTAFVSNKRLYDEELAKGDLAVKTKLNEYKLEYEKFNKKKEYKLILMGVLYVANIVDAMADAYFASYDISDDLSFKVRPTLITSPSPIAVNFTYGIKMSFYF